MGEDRHRLFPASVRHLVRCVSEEHTVFTGQVGWDVCLSFMSGSSHLLLVFPMINGGTRKTCMNEGHLFVHFHRNFSLGSLWAGRVPDRLMRFLMFEVTWPFLGHVCVTEEKR